RRPRRRPLGIGFATSPSQDGSVSAAPATSRSHDVAAATVTQCPYDRHADVIAFALNAPRHGTPQRPPVTEPDERYHYRAIWLSDIHLGTPGCQAYYLLDFLRTHKTDTLYLVGDILDGWQLKK